jgi:mannose-1-phosphate guanylyltransferase
MTNDAHVWSIILAADGGRRRRALGAERYGAAASRPSCTFRRSSTLLTEALARARCANGADRVLTVVASTHRRWWAPLLAGLPSRSVLVQPANRGTATGILLALQHVRSIDPEASLLVLPSDLHVERDDILEAGIRAALEAVSRDPSAAVLLGIEPDCAGTGYGWIVPTTDDRLTRVSSFVERPDVATARRLLAGGALWNSFILVAHGSTLLDLFLHSVPSLVARLATDSVAVESIPTRLSRLYARLDRFDFPRHVLVPCAPRLRVLRTGPCGWTNLGMPERIAAGLQRLGSPAQPDARTVVREGAPRLTPVAVQARSFPRRRAHRRPPQPTGRRARIRR